MRANTNRALLIITLREQGPYQMGANRVYVWAAGRAMTMLGKRKSFSRMIMPMSADFALTELATVQPHVSLPSIFTARPYDTEVGKVGKWDR